MMKGKRFVGRSRDDLCVTVRDPPDNVGDLLDGTGIAGLSEGKLRVIGMGGHNDGRMTGSGNGTGQGTGALR